MIKNTYNWFVTSSEDSNKWSLRSKGLVVGLVGLLASFLATKGYTVTQDQIQFVVGQFTQVAGAIGFVVGFVRAIANSVDEKVNQ